MKSTHPQKQAPKLRFPLTPFDQINLPNEERYTIKGLLPREGLALIWGPPKCGKSFFVLDAAMHIALGREYRGHKVLGGPVVYLAAEGVHGFAARVVAFRRNKMAGEEKAPQFYLAPFRVDLISDHNVLIQNVEEQLAGNRPVAIVIDTLNRTFVGSESNDADMAAYITAADAIREHFHCCVVIIHHCGIESNRPRGHSSLSGAIDTQISIRSRARGDATATVELNKDGPEGASVSFTLATVELGLDSDGDPVTSCVVSASKPPVASKLERIHLGKFAEAMLEVLANAGPEGLSRKDWYEAARKSCLPGNRPATLTEGSKKLKELGLVECINGHWHAIEVSPSQDLRVAGY